MFVLQYKWDICIFCFLNPLKSRYPHLNLVNGYVSCLESLGARTIYFIVVSHLIKMVNEVSQSGKRVVGRSSSAHHVRVEDCQCGESDQEIDVGDTPTSKDICYTAKLDEIVDATLTLTATSVVVIMAAVVSGTLQTGTFDIQRPIGTSVLDQETIQSFGGQGCDEEPALFELEACEELPAGTYTWTLFANETTNVYAAWIKAHSVT